MLADVIHKVAKATQDDEQPYHPRPSMASPTRPDDPGRCIRQMVYHRLDTPAAPLPGRALLVFDDGKTHEDLTIKWLEKAAVIVHGRQFPVDVLLPRPIGEGFVCTVCGKYIPPDRMHGHIDALVDDFLGITRLLELKAINHFSFQEALAGVPPMDYVVQCCCYLRGLQQAGHDIREAILLIKNKNTAQYVELRIQYDAVSDSVFILTKRLRPVILGALEAAGAKSGLGGGHVAKVVLQHREILDEDLIPAPIRRAATIPRTVEILKVDALKLPRAGQPPLTS